MSECKEAADVLEIEKANRSVDLKDDPNYDEEFTYKEQRKIVHKIDRRLITALGLLFAVSLMDRTNLGTAAIEG
jgi:hypothetical protein